MKTEKLEISILMGISIFVGGMLIYNKYRTKAHLGASDVDGIGLKANEDISKGDKIGIVKDSNNLTSIAKGINHSNIHNGVLETSGDKINLIASKPIKKNEEIFIDYDLNPIGFSTDTIGFR